MDTHHNFIFSNVPPRLLVLLQQQDRHAYRRNLYQVFVLVLSGFIKVQ